MRNIYSLPSTLPSDEELFETLWFRPGLRVERIISTGQCSPDGFWYDQEEDEWILLARGRAVISFEDGERISLSDGDVLSIPAHRKHRVEETESDPPCVWIALFRESSVTRTAEEWIQILKLTPHPEGGYFREVYRSDEILSAESLARLGGTSRALSTSIYFLLKGDQVSRFHRLRSDEIWHHHDGASITLHLLRSDGSHITRVAGKESRKGDEPQVLIPRGTWFSAEVNDPTGYALVSCTVAPGFDFADFEMGERRDLLERYPEHHELVLRFTGPAR